MLPFSDIDTGSETTLYIMKYIINTSCQKISNLWILDWCESGSWNFATRSWNLKKKIIYNYFIVIRNQIPSENIMHHTTWWRSWMHGYTHTMLSLHESTYESDSPFTGVDVGEVSIRGIIFSVHKAQCCLWPVCSFYRFIQLLVIKFRTIVMSFWKVTHSVFDFSCTVPDIWFPIMQFLLLTHSWKCHEVYNKQKV